MKVCKIFTFDAAHKLPNYDGMCAQLHGHTYKLEVIVDGDVSVDTGMVIDFSKLSWIVKSRIIDRLDHTYLNDFIENPTAEKLAEKIHDILSDEFVDNKDINGNYVYPLIISLSVRLWETPTSWVEYDGTD